MDFSDSSFDIDGFMAIDLITGKTIYCRNTQDAIDKKLSGGSHIYSTTGKDFGNGNYIWQNPLTGECEYVHYNEPTKETSFYKSIFTRKK